MRRLLPTLLLLVAAAARVGGAAEPAPSLSSADRAAVFKAAGFKAKGGKYVRCEEDPPTASYVPGAIVVVDLNGDGRPEAFVTESSTFCYGAAGAAVVLVTKDASGSWRKILDETGIHLVLETKHQGWPDIEVGGPGMGKQPVFRWNGAKYMLRK